MGMNNEQATTEDYLNMLRCLTVGVNRTPLDKGAWKVCDKKRLKSLLLETGGEVISNRTGEVLHYDLKYVHLGVGVYRVYLEKVR